MNDELERMWKEAVVAKFKILSRYFLEGLRKTTNTLRIAGLRAVIWSQDLLNKKQEC
jgi:hypothetical protein